MSMDDAINLLKKKIADATAEKSALAEQAAADEGFLKSLKTDCAATATAWEARQKDAAAEMEAIEKAKEILASGVKALVQVSWKNAKGRAAIRKGDDDDAAEQKEERQRMNIQKVLQTLGHKYNSFAMMELASAAGADPFGKVKGLINDMVTKLLDEAAKEADQKAFCDTEIGKSRKAKDAKSR